MPLEQALQMDVALRVRQHQPRRGIEQERGTAEHRDNDGDAAHDDGVDAEPCGDTAADAADPAVLSIDAEGSEPAEEPLAPALRRGLLWVGGAVRGRSASCVVVLTGMFRHASIVPEPCAAPRWGMPLIGP